MKIFIILILAKLFSLSLHTIIVIKPNCLNNTHFYILTKFDKSFNNILHLPFVVFNHFSLHIFSIFCKFYIFNIYLIL